MKRCPGTERALAGGLVALLLLGPTAADTAQAGGRRRIPPDRIVGKVSQDEIKRELEPGRLIFDTGYKRRFLALQSVVKQAMDWKYSQKMVEDIAKAFQSPRYRPIAVQIDPNLPRPTVIDPYLEQQLEPTPPGPPPGVVPPPGDEGNIEQEQRPRDPSAAPIDLDVVRQPSAPGDGAATPVAEPPPGMSQSEWERIARDLENGIHNEILRVSRSRGYELAALNVFAQNLDVVKVILIVLTRDLPNGKVRGTLRDVRQVIEREVLAAKYPGVHLAELSSFTILNEQDGHFYEHPVLYWQMMQPGWSGAPAAPGRIHGEAPAEGGVSASGDSLDDYFTSREFQPEEDFDDREFLEPLDGF